MVRVLVPATLVLTLLAGCADELPDAPPVPREAAPGAAGSPAEPAGSAPQAINPRLLRRFRPLRVQVDLPSGPASPALIALGQLLFFDTRLSQARDLSCNSCHQLDRYGVDAGPTSVGASGVRGARNAPSVFHAAGHVSQFWDGRAADVEAQAAGPILNPKEMAMASPRALVTRLAGVPGYVTRFRDAFPGERDALTFTNVGRALGAFERMLVAPSRWDRYLEGDARALSAEELEGLKLFADIGCVECHTGEYLGGSMLQKLGVATPWPSQLDQGRFAITSTDADRMMFKVPSLRNVTKSAPYFHDGSVASLDESVRLMARHQLGIELTAAEVASLVAWLDTLTGELPERYVVPPVLPPDPL